MKIRFAVLIRDEAINSIYHYQSSRKTDGSWVIPAHQLADICGISVDQAGN